MNLDDIVVIDKNVLGGIPVFKGTRVPVKNLFDYLRAGDSLNKFMDDFDYISKESCLIVLSASENAIYQSIIKNDLIEKPSDFIGN